MKKVPENDRVNVVLGTSSMLEWPGRRERSATVPFLFSSHNMITKPITQITWLGILALTASFGLTFLAGCKEVGTTTTKPSNDSLAARGTKPKSVAQDTIQVVAATYPVAWLGCAVVGNPCRSVALVPPGASAHSWEPRPSDLQKLEHASFFIQAGLAFEEAWIPRFCASIPQLMVVDARSGLDLPSVEPGHPGHASEESDPHVWSSPRAMDHLAKIFADHLLQVRPALEPRVTENLPRLHKKLLDLDTAVRVLLAPFSGKTFLVNHPGLGYLARDYGLTQKPLESHGQELTPFQLFDIRRTAKSQGIRAIFIQNEYSRRTADQVAKELGVSTVDVDLLEEGAYDSLFLLRVRTMAEKL